MFDSSIKAMVFSYLLGISSASVAFSNVSVVKYLESRLIANSDNNADNIFNKHIERAIELVSQIHFADVKTAQSELKNILPSNNSKTGLKFPAKVVAIFDVAPTMYNRGSMSSVYKLRDSLSLDSEGLTKFDGAVAKLLTSKKQGVSKLDLIESLKENSGIKHINSDNFNILNNAAEDILNSRDVTIARTMSLNQ